MDKEKNTRLPLVDLIEVKPMQDGYRWVAITAMLFAIGIILHTVSPNVGGVTPNWTIAMYSIVINLTNPTLSQAVGIGFIAGITLVPSSKSAFPLGNIASELSGAITCCILVKAMLRCGLGKWKLRPLVTGFLATMASGGVFTFILKIVLGLPLHVWLYAMLPVVAIVGALNGTTIDFSFTASASDLTLVMKAISAANLDKDAKASPLISVGYSKLNLFGEDMVTSCGVAARALNALAMADIEVLLITTSDLDISLLVRSENEDAAYEALKKAYEL